MCEDLRDYRWLYRGVPHESEERLDVRATGEVCPPRRDRIGEDWIQQHQAGYTVTGYTSWTTNRSFAVEAAQAKSGEQILSGRIVVFRVRILDLSMDVVFQGREDEDEYLIQGRVEEVSISRSEDEDEEEKEDAY